MDGDGWLDIVYSSEGYSSVSFFSSTGAAHKKGYPDVHGDTVWGDAPDLIFQPAVPVLSADLARPAYGVKSFTPLLHTCLNCPAGEYAMASSGAACNGCMPGYFSSYMGASSPDTCKACPAGTFSGGAYADSCTPCPANTYAAHGSPRCYDCGECMHANDERTKCEPCLLCTLVGDSHVCHTESNSNQTHIYDETDDELERAAEDSAAGRTSTQQLGAVAATATLAALLVAGRRAA